MGCREEVRWRVVTALVFGPWMDEGLRTLGDGDLLTIVQYGSVRGAMRAQYLPSRVLSKGCYWAKFSGYRHR